MAARRDRTHHTGHSNRTGGVTVHTVTSGVGPIDFDTTARNAASGAMSHKLDKQVPIVVEGSGNQDFAPKLPGHDYRQFNCDPRETAILKKQGKDRLSATATREAEKPPATIRPKHRMGEEVTIVRQERQPRMQPAGRWDPGRWFAAPTYEQCPLHKQEGEAWNHEDSKMNKRDFKAHDRLNRTVWRPEDAPTPRSDSGSPAAKHPVNFDHEEYYPGRSALDGGSQDSGNDFQIRPINLPDFAVPPNGDPISRMSRLREMLKQRYAGRPGLLDVFRNCCLTKKGFAFSKDLQSIFDKIGCKVDEGECDLLVRAVDKDRKGAVSFQEFADLVLGPEVAMGGSPHIAEARHVHHITKTLVDSILNNGQRLGRAFCELDPERRYVVDKQEFAKAIGTACHFVSKQAVEFLWSSQFPGRAGKEVEEGVVNWPSFINKLENFAHDNRPTTPCCVQGRKRQCDLLMRTFPLTGGEPGSPDLSRPEQNDKDETQIIADRLVPRPTDLAHKPRQAAMLTEPYIEDIQTKAQRVERLAPGRIPKSRMRQLLANRSVVHQDELVDLMNKEYQQPNSQSALASQKPAYAAQMPPGPADGPAGGRKPPQAVKQNGGVGDGAAPASPLAGGRLALGDFHSYAATQRTNRDNEIHVEDLLTNLYKPTSERKSIERVNDGLNRNLRGHPPARERPAHTEVPRHENYWQARRVMESLGESIAEVECQNGGKLKPSRMFKRLDIDGDGYLTMTDLKQALDKYKIPSSSADIHACMSELDKTDKGAVDIGDFTRNFQMHQASVLDSMAKPIRCVYHEGGVGYAGPVQDRADAQEAEVAARHAENQAAHQRSLSRSVSEPLTGLAERSSSSHGSVAGSGRSNLSGTGASIAMSATSSQLPIYCSQVGLLTGEARVTDVIRARCSQWKPARSELYTSPARTRFGMTAFPDTRHVTEADMPLSGSFMPDQERFKTTYSMNLIHSAPDPRSPQVEDSIRMHAKNEFRVERIKHRQREFTERCYAANAAAQQFDELKVARKALNQFNYERKCRMACA